MTKRTSLAGRVLGAAADRIANHTGVAIDIRNLALITHRVPADRLRDHIPRDLELDTRLDESGREIAFVSTTCFFNQNLRWAPLPFPRISFHQVTYRTYVKHGTNEGVYFFGSCFESRASLMLEGLFMREAALGHFDIHHRRGLRGYSKYTARIESSMGDLAFEIQATDSPEAKPPFREARDLTRFFTHRLHGYTLARPVARSIAIGRGLLDLRVRHQEMSPWSGSLRSGRFGFWDRLGILSPSEAIDPYSILVQPRIAFAGFPPVPVAPLRHAEQVGPISEAGSRRKERERRAA